MKMPIVPPLQRMPVSLQMRQDSIHGMPLCVTFFEQSRVVLRPRRESAFRLKFTERWSGMGHYNINLQTRITDCVQRGRVVFWGFVRPVIDLTRMASHLLFADLSIYADSTSDAEYRSSARLDHGIIRHSAPALVLHSRMFCRVRSEICRVVMIATHHRYPAVVLRQTFLYTPKHLVIRTRFLKPESAISCHNHQRIVHPVADTHFVHQRYKLAMYIPADNQ